MPDEKILTGGIDRLRRSLVELGLTSQQAAVAMGPVAEYAQQAYRQGFERGFDCGCEFASRKAGESKKKEGT